MPVAQAGGANLDRPAGGLPRMAGISVHWRQMASLDLHRSAGRLRQGRGGNIRRWYQGQPPPVLRMGDRPDRT